MQRVRGQDQELESRNLMLVLYDLILSSTDVVTEKMGWVEGCDRPIVFVKAELKSRGRISNRLSAELESRGRLSDCLGTELEVRAGAVVEICWLSTKTEQADGHPARYAGGEIWRKISAPGECSEAKNTGCGEIW